MPIDYCSASGGCVLMGGNEYISGVHVGMINSWTFCGGYNHYSSITTTMGIGIGYPITVDIGDGLSNDRGGLWVDWNQDLDFDDADETITTAWSGVGPYTAVITPPAWAALGETRMRVRLQSEGTPSPCGNTDLGEVEDYTINVAESVMISGYVKTGAGVGVEGVEMSPSTGEPATTDTNGYYELTVLSGWTGSVTPGKTGWFFDPPALYYFDLSSDMSNQNYTATYGISILAIEDTYADSGDPCANYGSDDGFCSGNNGGSIYRAYLKFDLSGIPAGNFVTSATLRIDNSFITTPAPELDVYRVSDRWEESTVTWNDQPSNVYSPVPIMPNRSLVSGDTTTWDVTDDVDGEYVDDGFYSVKIVSPDETSDRRACFWSKEVGVSEWAPTLIIEYEPIFGGGTGEPDDPYQIWTPEQFNTIGLHPNRWSKHFKLMDNISMAAYSGSSYNLIGTSTSMSHAEGGEFRGVFDGNYHTISDFSNSKGVFGYVYDGTIKCLKLDSPDISSSSNDSVGGLVGSVDSTNIMDCSVIGGTVSGDNYVGGFAGYCKSAKISDCSSSASVSGNDYVGGFIGRRGSFGGGGVLSNCYATGSVGGLNCVGGFMGDSSDTAVINCYSTGLVAGTTNVGAFFGYNNNQFTLDDTAFDCFWDSDINPTLPAIGNIADPCSLNITDPCRIIGESTANMQTQTTFTNAGWDFVGETANGGSDDWAMPGGGGYPVLWHQLPVAPPLPPFAGGAGTAGNPYLIATETQLNSIGHNSRLMDKHFKLINDLDMDGLKYYMIAPEPYVLSGTFDGNGHTISNILLEPLFSISSFGFIGCLMGTEASIQDLTLVDPNVNSDWGWGVGSLVGKNEGGTITNCHAANANIRGWMSVGGLVGANYSYGMISGCSATGNVSENTFMSIIFSCVGGLVGENTFWSEIENSFAKCNVSGDDCLGGLVGESVIYSPITNCYAGGSVTGTTNYIGGLVGRFASAFGIEYCYSSSVVTGPNESESVGGLVGGKIGSSSVSDYFTACFWDSQINPGLAGIGNATDPCGVIGESTANMQTDTTFTSAGWDFLGETANGTEDIWAVLEGIDYPEFVWEGPLAVSLDIDSVWMYQNVLDLKNSKLTASVSILDDPLENTGYIYEWEFILPDDVSIAPTITEGGTLSDPCCTFAAPGCDQPAGLSDSGQALTVKVTVTGDDYGNSATAEAQFGIALLGDANNDGVVNVADRAIINAFWRTGSAGPYTFTDCDINCDTAVNVADRSIANAVWRGVLGQNKVTNSCSLR